MSAARSLACSGARTLAVCQYALQKRVAEAQLGYMIPLQLNATRLAPVARQRSSTSWLNLSSATSSQLAIDVDRCSRALASARPWTAQATTDARGGDAERRAARATQTTRPAAQISGNRRATAAARHLQQRSRIVATRSLLRLGTCSTQAACTRANTQTFLVAARPIQSAEKSSRKYRVPVHCKGNTFANGLRNARLPRGRN